MATENKILQKQALAALKGKWGLAAGTFIIFFMISSILSGVSEASSKSLSSLGTIIFLLVDGALILGLTIFSLSISLGTEDKVEQLFQGFKRYSTATAAYLLILLFIVLWTLLLIIPGIIAALSYSMTFYIIADNPSINAMDAIKKSKQMMDGYKWKLFRLYLRFLGWVFLYIISIIAIGSLFDGGLGLAIILFLFIAMILGIIGYMWLFPYMLISFAKFYDDIKGNTETSENIPEIPEKIM
jgi:uncharacterized membrane protein